MHYKELVGDAHSTQMIEETVILWHTLVASLITPLIERHAEPEVRPDGWAVWEWIEQQVEILEIPFFGKPVVPLPHRIDGMPKSLKKKALFEAMFFTWKPRNAIKIGEFSSGNSTALENLIVEYLNEDNNGISIPLIDRQFCDFVKIELENFDIKLLSKQSGRWTWREFEPSGGTGVSSQSPVELCILSKGSHLTLRSSQMPRMEDIVKNQELWSRTPPC
jgi:hypothetical protein